MDRELLVVGLGNPGPGYEHTRHNAGFMIVDALADHLHAPLWKKKWNGLTAEVDFGRARIHLVKPQTYMNRSGDAVRRFALFFKIAPPQILVIHDDLDMPPGRVKLVRGGGDGGHNGIRSLVALLGTKEFYRLKLGIGRPGRGGVHPDFPVERYVLAAFTSEEKQLYATRIKAIVGGLESFVDGDPARAMNVLNSIRGE